MPTNAQNPIAAGTSHAGAITPPEAAPADYGQPGPPEEAAPAFAALATGTRSARYLINEPAFTAWCDKLGEELESELPDQLDEQPAARLSSFADNAAHEGVIDQVAGLQLDVHGDDSYDVSGFYVLLSNRAGPQRHLFLTSGWNELYYLAEDADPRERARDYLETLCAIANNVLDGLYPQRVAGAETANILTLELAEGSSATWLLPDAQADAAEAAIAAACGPPDSQRC